MCVCLFIDTCGGNDFPAMRRLEISKGNSFVVVYAIDNRNSFDTCKKIVGKKFINFNGKGRVKIYRVPGPGPSTGGRRLFFEKNRGAKTFFRKKLGGRRLFF